MIPAHITNTDVLKEAIKTVNETTRNITPNNK
jgi:hypothetical protein